MASFWIHLTNFTGTSQKLGKCSIFYCTHIINSDWGPWKVWYFKIFFLRVKFLAVILDNISIFWESAMFPTGLSLNCERTLSFIWLILQINSSYWTYILRQKCFQNQQSNDKIRSKRLWKLPTLLFLALLRFLNVFFQHRTKSFHCVLFHNPCLIKIIYFQNLTFLVALLLSVSMQFPLKYESDIDT